MANLKSLKKTSLCIFLGGEARSADRVMPILSALVGSAPSLTPEVWGTDEPIRRPFSVDDVANTLSQPGWNFSFIWKKKIAPKVHLGSFSPISWRANGVVYHATWRIDFDLYREYEEEVIRLLKETCATCIGDYGYVDWLSPQFEKHCFAVNERTVYGGSIQMLKGRPTENLPDIFWSQTFGPPYVRLLGLEKLLTAPAYKVEQLGPEMVYIQLSESLFDMHEKYEEVDAVRQRVKAHLDDNIFFKPENPEEHVYRTPDFKFPTKPETATVNTNVVRTTNVPNRSEVVKYDDASWHWGASDFPNDLPQEAGATHIGMFVAWALLAGLGDAENIDANVLFTLKQQSSPPGRFLMENFGGKFLSTFLGDEGNAFTKSYFYFDSKRKSYLVEYMATLSPNNPEPYYGEDSWDSFRRLKPILDARLEEWRRASDASRTDACLN